MVAYLWTLITALFMTASTAFSTTLTVNPNRTVRIIGNIQPSAIGFVDELFTLAETSQEPVDVIITSPGGMVEVGEVIQDAIRVAQARGIVVRCFVPVAAASMAFNILDTCSERYAFKTAKLLFHPVRVYANGIPLTAKLMADLAVALHALDGALLDRLEASLGLDRDELEKAFYEERVWSAEELAKITTSGWLTIVEDVKGLKNPFKGV